MIKVKIIKRSDETVFLGRSKGLGLYLFITRMPSHPGELPTIEAYSQCKLVDNGKNEVYYCDNRGVITKNRKPVSYNQVKSMLNSRDSRVLECYQSYLNNLLA